MDHRDVRSDGNALVSAHRSRACYDRAVTFVGIAFFSRRLLFL